MQGVKPNFLPSGVPRLTPCPDTRLKNCVRQPLDAATIECRRIGLNFPARIQQPECAISSAALATAVLGLLKQTYFLAASLAGVLVSLSPLFNPRTAMRFLSRALRKRCSRDLSPLRNDMINLQLG